MIKEDATHKTCPEFFDTFFSRGIWFTQFKPNQHLCTDSKHNFTMILRILQCCPYGRQQQRLLNSTFQQLVGVRITHD